MPLLAAQVDVAKAKYVYAYSEITNSNDIGHTSKQKQKDKRILTLKDGSPIRRRQHCILSLAGPTHFHSGDTKYALTASLPSLLRLF